MLTGFLVTVFWLVTAANARAPAHAVLEPRQMVVALGAFLAVVATWVSVLNMRVSRETA
jgi:hypothetical protein